MDEFEAKRLRRDISTLLTVLEGERTREPPDNIVLQACSEVLRDRRARLEELEGVEHGEA